MEERKRKALEAAGWKFGDAEDFLNDTGVMAERLNASVLKIDVGNTTGGSNPSHSALEREDGKRVYVEWSDGSWVNSLHSDFVGALIERTEKCGPPVKVEVRDETQWINGNVENVQVA